HKWPFPFKAGGTVVLHFILKRLSRPKSGDLALGDLDNLAALQADIAQLAIGELLELVDPGEAAEPVSKTSESATDQAAKGLMGPVRGKSGEARHGGNLSKILEVDCLSKR